jgi:organic hydroperoxide reductase OsmC/OhrA
MLDHPHPGAPSAVDLVWDGDLGGTALSRSGRRLRVGTADWTPDTLVALAYGASVMQTFLTLAARAGLDMRAYVSAVTVESRPGGRSLILSPCVMVASAHAVDKAERLLAQAVAEAPIAGWVHAAVELRAHVHPPSMVDPHAVIQTPEPRARPARPRRHGHDA